MFEQTYVPRLENKNKKPGISVSILTKKRLQQNLADAKEKIKSDAKMYKSVSLFTGIGIAVLLI